MAAILALTLYEADTLDAFSWIVFGFDSADLG